MKESNQPIKLYNDKTIRKRWNPEVQAVRIKKIMGGKSFPNMDRQLAEDRSNRKL